MNGRVDWTDQLNRPLRDIRISVTDRCNFRCGYCMPAEVFGPDYAFLHNKELLTFTEILRLIRLFTGLGVEKVRLTGGEPLLRADLPDLIRGIREIDSVMDIALTTNASLLQGKAEELKKAGLDRVNVSLDALDEEVFRRMNGDRSDVNRVLTGIEAAAEVGLRVKVNMVVQKGINDHEVLPMAQYFKEKGHTLRFIEYMDVGNSNSWNRSDVVSKNKMVEQIGKEMPLIPMEASYFGEVASRYRYKGTDQEIGFISSVSEPFCGQCTRARLSAEGQLYTCLFASGGVDLRAPLRQGAEDDELLKIIRETWGERKDRYSEERGNHPSSYEKIEMSYIGG
ncbi:cyclic pyranopterin phosphate synthase [Marininema mesophilum]|uniref:GTP 3',8-cyclase n=1 Tax=Marininema mesophilum TaxID=1048340 RepID=A0A1H3AX37_9BACL|nr:GTP 3',8-cyclase MoaA [Marininema mesophilum]SDX34262.1 cyclic pyranopterin phosphate synthase [Marininema mesophilum]